MRFDPQSAREAYAAKGSDELIAIAYLERDFVPEAKRLALDELARRGIDRVSDATLEQVRHVWDRERELDLDRRLADVESEEVMPAWRQRLRRALVPYRTGMLIVVGIVFAVAMVSSFSTNELMGLTAKQRRSIAIVAGLLALIFLSPSREECKQRLIAEQRENPDDRAS